MGRDIPSRVAPSENEMAVEIGAPMADDETMTPVSPVALDNEHVSPELALVDPDLAGRLRVELPEPELERRPAPRVEHVVHLRLAPPPLEKPDVVAPAVEGPAVAGEPQAVEEQVVVAVPRIDAVAPAEPDVVERPPLEEPDVVAAVEGPAVVGEPQVVEEPVVVAVPRIDAVDPAEPDVVDRPEPLPYDAAPITRARAPEPAPGHDPEVHGDAPVELEARPVVAQQPSPAVPVARRSSVWPAVPDESLSPGRPRLRRVLFVLGLGLVAASIAVVGVTALTGDSDPPPLTFAEPKPEPAVPTPQPAVPTSKPAAPQTGSGEAQSGGSKPASPPSATASKPSAPAAAPATGSRRLVWAPVDGAVSYRVELFRGDRQVLRETTRNPAIDIPAKWKHLGRSESLAPGTYRWYVWPVLSSGPAARAVVQAKLVVP